MAIVNYYYFMQWLNKEIDALYELNKHYSNDDLSGIFVALSQVTRNLPSVD